jgi:hypothetical protein
MTIKQINNLTPGRLRALTGMTVKAMGELLAIVLPELVRRRAAALHKPMCKSFGTASHCWESLGLASRFVQSPCKPAVARVTENKFVD